MIDDALQWLSQHPGNVIFIMVFSGLIGCLAGSTNDRKLLGFVTGVFLGPIGWLLVRYGGDDPAVSSSSNSWGGAVVLLGVALAVILVSGKVRLGAAPAPLPVTAQAQGPYFRVIPRATPTSAEVQADILKRYGARR